MKRVVSCAVRVGSRGQRRHAHRDGRGAMTTISREVSDQLVQVGKMLRRARRGRFTVEELASQASVSSGLISQIERGQGNPSFATLQKLAGALGLSLASIFSEPMPNPKIVVRRAERPKLVMPADGLVYELLTPRSSGLAMVQTQVPGEFSNEADPFVHPGEECVHVLRGELTVAVGESQFDLRAGDTMRFDSGIPHWWRNCSKRPAILIGAISEGEHVAGSSAPHGR
jgi:transcriptional regulator with XRE-family HTH domain